MNNLKPETSAHGAIAYKRGGAQREGGGKGAHVRTHVGLSNILVVGRLVWDMECI